MKPLIWIDITIGGLIGSWLWSLLNHSNMLDA